MSWVGGDIAGLQAMGWAMGQATSKTNDIVSTLEGKVDTLANDAEWRGVAGTAFRQVWSESALEIGSVNATVTDAGTVIKTLGDELARLENSLHDTADEYAAKGVPIGPNGEPQTVTVTGDASASPAKDILQAAKEYKELYDSTMLLATKARSDAANNLSDLLDAILPPEGADSGDGVGPDVKASAADYVRGLLVIPNEKLSRLDNLRAELRDARQRFKATRKPLQAAKAEYSAKGLKLPATADAALAHSRALKELNAVADQISNAGVPKGVLPGSEWLNIKLADLAGDSGALAKVLPKLGFLKNVPVLDIAATGFIGAVQGKEDYDKGRGAVQAYGSDLAAGAVGLGAGVATGAGITAGAAALGVSAPVSATAIAAGAVVIGVGNIASAAVDEHWMEDIHNDGVVAGIAEGVAHSVSGGIKETGSQVADVSKSIWHGIFG